MKTALERIKERIELTRTAMRLIQCRSFDGELDALELAAAALEVEREAAGGHADVTYSPYVMQRCALALEAIADKLEGKS